MKRQRGFIGILLAALLLTGCASGGAGQAEWVEGGWIQRNTLVSLDGALYAYLGSGGRLYRFDPEAGTKQECLVQCPSGRQGLYYLQEDGGLLYAAGVCGSGGFVWADPASGEAGPAGVFPQVRISDCALEGGTLYLAGRDLTAPQPVYGIWRTELRPERAQDGAYAPPAELDAGEPLLRREGDGEIITVIARSEALLLHEYRPREGGGSRMDLLRLDLESGEETLLAGDVLSPWTPCVDGRLLALCVEEWEPQRRIRPVILNERGEVLAELEALEDAAQAAAVRAGQAFALDWRNGEGVRTLSLIDPKTGSVRRSTPLDSGWSQCLGSDGERLYFWDSERPAEGAKLMRLDAQTLESAGSVP